MLNAYKATYKNGELIWLDTPPNLEHQEFDVIFLQKEQPVDKGRYDPNKKGERRVGALAGKVKFPDDINKYDDEILEIFGID